MHFEGEGIDWDACYHITEERYLMAPEIFVREGDVLITKDGSIGKLAHVKNLPGKASLNSHLLIVRPVKESYDSRFLYYLLGADVFQRFILMQQKGTTFNGITQESVENFCCILPPIDEQSVIAGFLDHKTERIDALISKKERQIELLQEKRAALISHAVTKGLDPSVKMKDSGVEWLGEIPQDWSMVPLKFLTKTISKGTTPSTVGEEFQDSGIRFVRGENVTLDGISETPATYIDEATNRLLRRSILEKDDVVIIIAGATTGKAAVVEDNILPANTNQAVAFIRLWDKQLARFLCYWLSSCFVHDMVWTKAVQSAQPNLSMEDIKNFIVPLPPLEKVKDIQAYLAHRIKESAFLICNIGESLDLLREYRAALISASVTGKIDVRGEVS